MWDFIDRLNTEHGIFAVVLGYAWRALAGEKQRSIEQRAKEAARAGWHAARLATGLDGLSLVTAATERTRRTLDQLGVPWSDKVARLVAHELTVIGNEDAVRRMPRALDELHRSLERMPAAWKDAERRGLERHQQSQLVVEPFPDDDKTPRDKPGGNP